MWISGKSTFDKMLIAFNFSDISLKALGQLITALSDIALLCFKSVRDI